MRKLQILLLLLILLPVGKLSAADKIKVACVGNSITFGAGIKERATDSYPAQLQRILGKEYEVRNFGINSRTLLSKGDFPYIQSKPYEESLAFEPDIILIKLGTNDSKPQNYIYLDEFEVDYQALIESYRALPSSPRIILVTPLKCYLGADAKNKISDERIVEGITPAIERVAKKNRLEIVNGYPICGTELNLELLPDRLHPSAQGAKMMAEYFSRVILRR